jgi:hypothetical protein
MISQINRRASIAESIDNCQHSPLRIHTSRIAYHITRLSDESMIRQEGLERKVKLCNIFVYNALGPSQQKLLRNSLRYTQRNCSTQRISNYLRNFMQNVQIAIFWFMHFVSWRLICGLTCCRHLQSWGNWVQGDHKMTQFLKPKTIPPPPTRNISIHFILRGGNNQEITAWKTPSWSSETPVT